MPRLAIRLRALAFQEDTREGAPLCRWVNRGTTLDVMPLDEKILGFSNRWYRAAMESSVTERLSDDLEIRIVTGPFFIATKLDAVDALPGYLLPDAASQSRIHIVVRRLEELSLA